MNNLNEKAEQYSNVSRDTERRERILSLELDGYRKAAIERLTVHVVLVNFVGYILLYLVLYPVYNICASDVLLRSSFITGVLNFLCVVLEPLIFILSYPAVLYGYYVGTARRARPAVMLAVITVFKYVFNYVISSLFEGWPMTWETVGEDASIILPSCLLELLQLGLMILLAFFLVVKNDRNTRDIFPGDSQDPYVPILRILDLKNRLTRVLFIISCVILTGALCNHLINYFAAADIGVVVDTPAQLILDLAADVFYGVLFYLMGILSLNLYHKKALKRLTASRDAGLNPEV